MVIIRKAQPFTVRKVKAFGSKLTPKMMGSGWIPLAEY